MGMFRIALALLCLTDVAHFYKLKVCGNPAWSKSSGANSLSSFPVSASHWVILQTVSNVFITVVFGFCFVLF